MESLYTKYRPQTFADVVGQTHVVTTLQRAVIEGRTSHAYLFCGPRGTGKTTMARLLAKALMCEQGEGHLPDGTCDQCRMIAAGEHPDVYELDAASRTGVDNVRDEIISRVSFAPVQAPYKMYIIDEVHMLTTAAFNALLKTLEEPPSHVVFVLCTTDPQKIPETILSRVQRFDFHSIGHADIQGRLAYICEREGFTYDPEALELVVRHARGGMRDAISELEQLSVSGGGAITVDIARDVLGEVSASTLERISLAMANRDVPTLFAQVESLVEVGRDLLQFTRALTARLRDVYVVAAIGASSSIVSAADDDLPAISREAKAFGSVDRVARALSLLSDASTEMRVAPNQRLVLEVALTKIARPQSELTLDALADRVASLEKQIVALSVMEPRRAPETGEKAPGARGRTSVSGQHADLTQEPTGTGGSRRAARTSETSAPSAQPGSSVRQTATEVTTAEQSQRGSIAVDVDGASTYSGNGTNAESSQMPVHEGLGVPISATSVAARQASQNTVMSSGRMPSGSAAAGPDAAQAHDSGTERDGSSQASAHGHSGVTTVQPGAPARRVAQEESVAVGQAHPNPSGAAQAASSRQVPRSGATGSAAARPAQQGAAGRGAAQSFVAGQTTASGVASRHAHATQQTPAPSVASEAPAGKPSEQSPAIVDKGELQRRWKQVVDGLLASHPQHGSLLMNSTVVADDGSQLTVSFPKGSMFACRMLERPDVRANVDPAIAQVFGPRKTRFAEGATAPAHVGAPAQVASRTASPTSPAASQRPASTEVAQGYAASAASRASASGGGASGFGAGTAAQPPVGQHAASTGQPQRDMQRAEQPQPSSAHPGPSAEGNSQRQTTQAPDVSVQYSGSQAQSPAVQLASSGTPAQPQRSASGSTPIQSQRSEQAGLSAMSSSQRQTTQARSAYLAPWEADAAAPPSAQDDFATASNAQYGSAAASSSPTQQGTTQSTATLPDDMVPYDDYDMTPYEEEFAFGYAPEPVSQAYPTVGSRPEAGWQGSSAPAYGAPSTSGGAAPAVKQQPATPVPWADGGAQSDVVAQANRVQPDAAASQVQGAPVFQGDHTLSQLTGANSTNQGGAVPTLTPQPPSDHEASVASSHQASEAVTAPTVDAPENGFIAVSQASSTQPSSSSYQADSANQAATLPTSAAHNTVPSSKPDAAPTQQPATAASEKPKRTRRAPAAIPADIIAMMAEIFGEGVTYTSLDPEDQEDEVVDEPTDEDDTESEFIEEPVDDADFDEDE